MAGTISDKVLDAHVIETDPAEDILHVRIDALLGHDATVGLLMHRFEQRGLTIWDPSRVVFVNDHFSPPATAERAEISAQFLAFARRHEVAHLMVDRGICHQLLAEHELCQPGRLIVGADSHTIMAGAVGACATGMGSTDIMFALATGTTWMRRPETIKVTFRGRLGEECSGRDVALRLLSILGEHGARYRTLEFHDRSDGGLAQDERFGISNLAVEMGAKFGIFAPDEVTAAYCRERDGRDAEAATLPDADATYDQALDVDVGALTPLVAKPWSPSNVVPLAQLERTPISMAFVGSCAGGRLSEIREAAEAVAGHRIHERVRFVVIPASGAVFRQALKLGYVEALSDAGAIFNQSSCGPCGGIDKGVLGATDVCVSTSNRNYRGRMGHWDSRTYLASARTVAVAALRGYVGDAA